METPCINICVIDSGSGLCEGCGRTMTEIASWASLTATERRLIMADLDRRTATRVSVQPSDNPSLGVDQR